MDCKATIKSDSYDFFENIEEYINKVKHLQHDESDEFSFDCSNIIFEDEFPFKNKEISISVCKELIKLFKYLNTDNKLRDCYKYKNDCGFFNYWVNSKIDKSRSNESYCIKKIYHGIDINFKYAIFYDRYFDSIYDINKDELDKMHILYNLYENYSKLNSIEYTKPEKDKQELLILSTTCCTDYIKASYICNGGNDNSQFCTELKNFKMKYERLYSMVEGKGPEYLNNFIKLTECEKTNTMLTALIGTTVGLIPLLGVLYKFTPLGQMFNSKKSKLTQVYGNNIDEMNNIKLMDQESEHISSQQGRYNIKYHSV